MGDDIRGHARSAVGRWVDDAASWVVRRADRSERGLEDRIRAAVRAECEQLVRAVHDVEFRARRDIHAAGERRAVRDTEKFVRAHLPTTPTFPHPDQTLAHALAHSPEDGMALEFGVFSGQSLKAIAADRAGRDVFGFDSFQGLPEDWRTNIPAGAFAVDAQPVVDGAELVVGWFADTLPDFLADHPGDVAFLHLDADLYSSTKTVLDHVGPRLRDGSVILFDEYFNYPGWEEHEHRAWREFVTRTGIRFDYLCYTSNDEQLAVRLRAA
ncbi:class I SAM-dependent methyltransferase [Actinokineospora auranticolor]|uniref:Macrocin-O-methyltransferase TylF n=1 Tax=Actinokineospora auranticolor TaxID=155976 RepID=A0A2S6GPT5_9PSEU|nr:class I SAM-dependent methyltransferase [Actinokineospora auranticolor]PPK67238.1 macrocin-O-methyltransferase TylF [Actinokineospora auranticolor]